MQCRSVGVNRQGRNSSLSKLQLRPCGIISTRCDLYSPLTHGPCAQPTTYGHIVGDRTNFTIRSFRVVKFQSVYCYVQRVNNRQCNFDKAIINFGIDFMGCGKNVKTSDISPVSPHDPPTPPTPCSVKSAIIILHISENSYSAQFDKIEVVILSALSRLLINHRSVQAYSSDTDEMSSSSASSQDPNYSQTCSEVVTLLQLFFLLL